MGWQLQLKTNLPLNLSAVDFDAVAALPPAEIARLQALPLQSGSQTIPLADAFQVSAVVVANAPEEVVLEGDLTNAVGVGCGLKAITLRVAGNTGPLAGWRMAGGKLTVEGNAGGGLGAGMTGGEIRLTGNVLGDVAPCLPGEKYGMNRGEIYIHGDATAAVGYRMRRGLILVAGRCVGIVGENMLAGTIVVGGDSGPAVGSGMRRGSILLNSPTPQSILPSFGEARATELVVCRLLRRYLLRQNAPLDLPWLDNPVRRFWGDPIYGNRGEVLLPS